MPENLKIYAKGGHIPIIDRSVQTTNKGECCTKHYVTYNRNTKLVTRSLVEYIIHSRNSFPLKGSIRKRLGSNTILLGNPSPNFNMKIIFFGFYTMLYTVTTNTFKRRSIPSIYLR